MIAFETSSSTALLVRSLVPMATILAGQCRDGK
jgi:hypothetical protein